MENKTNSKMKQLSIKEEQPKDSSKDSSQPHVSCIAVSREEIEVLMTSTTGTNRLTENTFIADSGASCHMRNSLSGMYDLIDHVQVVTVGNHERMFSKYLGKFKGTIIQQDGTYMDIVLNEVLFIPDLWLNLISITKAIKNENVDLSSKGELMQLKFGNEEYSMRFDKIFTTGSGQLLGVEIRPSEEYSTVAILIGALKIYEDMHEKLGHPNDIVVNRTARHYGMNEGKEHKPKKCSYCAAAKHRKQAIPKQVKNRTSFVGERINIDITSVKTPSIGGSKYWLLIQDDYSDYLWSFFLKRKDETTEKVVNWITIFQKETNITIKTIRCDNSGENRKMKDIIKSDPNKNIYFQFTAPYTPQQNVKIERKFQTLYGKIRSMLNWARLTERLRNKLWAHCADVTTTIENIIVKGNSEMSAHEIVSGIAPDIFEYLKAFGELAMVN